MPVTNSLTTARAHRRNVFIGIVLLVLALLSTGLTLVFVYVSNQASIQVEEIRQDYRKVADRRDAKVSKLTTQVKDLQAKVDALPDRTANKVNQVVKEDEKK